MFLKNISQAQQRIYLALAALLLMIVVNLMIEPLLIIRLTAAGTSAWQMGLFGSCFWLGIIAMSPFINRLVNRFGLKPIYNTAGLLPLLTLPIFYFPPNVWVWCICNLALGAGASFRWVMTESLIAASAPGEKRGQHIGFFQTLIALCFVIGPLLLSMQVKFLGQNSNIPFVIAAIGFLVSFLTFLWMPDTHQDNKQKGAPGFVRNFIRHYPIIIIVAFMNGIFESGPGAFLAFIGLKHNLPSEMASGLFMLSGLGSFIIQLPIGMIADRIAVRKLYVACNVLFLIGGIALLWINPFCNLLFPIALLWGAAGGAMYTLTIFQLGSLFKAIELITATSIFIFSFNIGTALGPTITGFTYQLAPYAGLPVMMTSLTLLSIIMILKSKCPGTKLTETVNEK